MKIPDLSSLDIPDADQPLPKIQDIPALKTLAENKRVNHVCEALGEHLATLKAQVGYITKPTMHAIYYCLLTYI